MKALRIILTLLLTQLTFSHFSQAQDDAGGGSDGGNKGVFEFGVLGSLLLPSAIPEANEVYPAFGPHIAMRTNFAVLEAQAILGIKDDSDSETVGHSMINQVLFVPVGMRFDFDSKMLQGYASLGGHGLYYSTHDASGGTVTGFSAGVNFGGGIMFPHKQLNTRLDFRILARPGTTVMLGLICFLSI